MELLDICSSGEDQAYEFKAQGTEARKITREVAALLRRTRQGGFIFYGVDDDGTVQGADVSRQKLDPSPPELANCQREPISPAATVKLYA